MVEIFDKARLARNADWSPEASRHRSNNALRANNAIPTEIKIYRARQPISAGPGNIVGCDLLTSLGYTRQAAAAAVFKGSADPCRETGPNSRGRQLCYHSSNHDTNRFFIFLARAIPPQLSTRGSYCSRNESSNTRLAFVNDLPTVRLRERYNSGNDLSALCEQS